MSKSPRNGKPSPGKGPARPQTQPRRGPRAYLRAVLKWTGTVIVWGFILSLFAGAWFAYDLPSIDDALKVTRRPVVTVLAADGSELYRAGDLYGDPVNLKTLPKALPEAVMATEDRRFYSHFGVDPVGLARAMWRNLRALRIVQGGSTITQQLAKNLFLTPDRTIKRKIQEVMLALWLETQFSKDQILTLYLNRVYLGSGTFGVDAAARRYFRKPATRLDTYECAVIAGLLKAPSRYNPIASPERSHARAKVVLANMVAAGYLTEAQASRAARGVQLADAGPATGRARHFVDWVLEALPDYVSTAGRDITVKTTLVPALQRDAEAAMARALAAGAKVKAGEGALVAMTPDGSVQAMVGGADYAKSQFNRAVQAQRQPGSAFKPFVYLTALEAGMTPDTVFTDKSVTIGKWKPDNFSGRYEGPMPLTQALAKSVNTIAAQLVLKLGPKAVAATARRLGISGDLPDDASLALGTGEVSLLELTGAYAVLARGGLSVWPHAIEEIRDRSGAVLYMRKGSGPERVAEEDTVDTLTQMMTHVITEGTGHNADIGRPAAGKTGTSQNYRDALFVGFTPQLVTGVWFGNDDGAPMHRVTGGGLPARAWADFMTAALKGVPVKDFPSAGGSLWDRIKRLVGSGSLGSGGGSGNGSGGGSGGGKVEEDNLHRVGD